MKKLLATTAAVTLALLTVPNLVPRSNAAPTGGQPTKSEYCKMAKAQRNPVAWNEHYHCLDKQAAAPVVERKREKRAHDPYCDMAKAQRNPVSWNERYHCLSSR